MVNIFSQPIPPTLLEFRIPPQSHPFFGESLPVAWSSSYDVERKPLVWCEGEAREVLTSVGWEVKEVKDTSIHWLP